MLSRNCLSTCKRLLNRKYSYVPCLKYFDESVPMSWKPHSALKLVPSQLAEIQKLDQLIESGTLNWQGIEEPAEFLQSLSEQFKKDRDLQWSAKTRLAFISQQKGNFKKESEILEGLLNSEIFANGNSEDSSEKDMKVCFKEHFQYSLCISQIQQGNSAQADLSSMSSLHRDEINLCIESETLSKQSLVEMMEKYCNDTKNNLVFNLIKIADILSKRESEYQLAEQCLATAEKRLEDNLLGKVVLGNIQLQNNCRKNRMSDEEFGKAIDECINFAETSFGYGSLPFAWSLTNIAILYKDRGDPIYSEGLFSSATSHLKKLLIQNPCSFVGLEYARSVTEFKHLLAHLEWNNKSRAEEGNRLESDMIQTVEKLIPNLKLSEWKESPRLSFWESYRSLSRHDEIKLL